MAATWPTADVQTCVVHLLRNTLRYTSRQHWAKVTKDLRTVYTGSDPRRGDRALRRVRGALGQRYPAVINLWRSSWEEFIPVLAFPSEVRSMIYTTNAIESLNAQFRRSTRFRGHFPNETSAIKILYLTIKTKDVGGGNAIGRVRTGSTVLNTLSFTTANGSAITNDCHVLTQKI